MWCGAAKAKTPRLSTGSFTELGPQRGALIEAVSMDFGPAFLKSVRTEGHAPQALVCADVFHLVKLVGDALDEVRRDLWQQLRRLPDDRYAKAFKGSRWALLKNPEDLTDNQATQLASIRRTRGGIWRAYEMKEQFRAIFTAGLQPADAIEQLDRWITRALRSRLEPFTKAARTMRDRRGIIINAIGQGISNGRVEAIIIWSASHHPPRLRLPLSKSSTRPRDARLRTDQPHPATRTTSTSGRRMTHITVRKAAFTT